MVGHQNVVVNLTSVFCRGFPKAIKIEAVILVSKKRWLAVVAALYDVLGHTCNA